MCDHSSESGQQLPLDDFSEGFFVGLLVGEGYFGGTGRDPEVTLRMHVRHEKLFRWLERVLPGGRLYGPYHHGGRNYYQWMARGRFLKEVVVPIVASRLPFLDDHVAARFIKMCQRYQISLPSSSLPSDQLAPHLVRTVQVDGRQQLTTTED